jgi:hypothetical protein
MTNKLLTFEYSKDGAELHVHMDGSGLQLLRTALESLADSTGPSHLHLQSRSWGGTELTEDQQSDEDELLHQVTLHYWPASEESSRE